MTSTRSLDHDLALLMASDPETMSRANDIWDALLAAGDPIEHAGSLLVSRYEDVRGVLLNPEVFNHSAFGQGRDDGTNTVGYSDAERAAYFEVAEIELNFINRSGDGDQHGRLRRIPQRSLTPARVASLTPTIERYLDSKLDEMTRRRDAVDLVGLTYWLPLTRFIQ